MAIDTVQELESGQLFVASQGEAPPSSFAAEEIDIIAFRLWRRASHLYMVGEDCGCCKGEAQQCYAACR